MTKRLFAIVVGVAIMVAGCTDPCGNPEGEYESLKADLNAQRSEIESILDDALGSYEVLGIDVSLVHCAPLSAWSGGTAFLVMPSDSDRHAAVDAIAAVLEGRGLVVDDLEPIALEGFESSREQTLPERSAEVPGFVTPLTFYSGVDPQPGVKIGVGGGCYGREDLGAEELLDLRYSEGSVTLVPE